MSIPARLDLGSGRITSFHLSPKWLNTKFAEGFDDRERRDRHEFLGATFPKPTGDVVGVGERSRVRVHYYTWAEEAPEFG